MVEIVPMSRDTGRSEEHISKGNEVVTLRRKKLEGKSEIYEQLLPGIPNSITLDLIAPKLPWTTFHLLSSVSHGWQQAIQSHQVYDARVHAQSSQTLLVMNDSNCREFTLLSLYDGQSYRLPPIPGRTQIPLPHQCICLDGKLYVLGEYKSLDVLSAEVYLLDLVARRQWRRCAGMANPRAKFGNGVINGKIYVFGGSSSLINPISNYASEVYDPESNSWSPIAPMKSPVLCPEVVNCGEELLVHWELNGLNSAEVYNPLNDQWRTADHSIQRGEIGFMAGGRLHKLSLNLKGDIDVHHICASSWKPVHTFSSGDIGQRDTFLSELLFAQLVDDELLVGAKWTHSHDVYGRWKGSGTCLLRVKGFGGQDKDLPWQNSTLSMFFEILPRHLHFLYPTQIIQL